jgi:hypothetical protein
MTSTRTSTATTLSIFVLALISAIPLHATAPDATLYTERSPLRETSLATRVRRIPLNF